jgi:hypothetical protein
MSKSSTTVPSVSVSLLTAVAQTREAWTLESARSKPTHFFRDLETDARDRMKSGRTPAQSARKLTSLLGILSRSGSDADRRAVDAESIKLGEAIEWAKNAGAIAAALPLGDKLREAANGSKSPVTGATIISRVFGTEKQAEVAAACGW